MEVGGEGDGVNDVKNEENEKSEERKMDTNKKKED